MAQIIGISNQEVYRRAFADAQSQITDIVKGTISNYDKLIEKFKTREAWDKALAIGSLLTGNYLTYYLLRGALNGAVDAGAGISQTLATLVNNLSHVFDENDGSNMWRDIGYMFSDFGLSIAEGLSAFGVGAAADIGGLFGKEKDWAYGEGGALDKVADFTDSLRADILTKNVDVYKQTDEQQKRNDEIIAQRWSDNPSLSSSPQSFLRSQIYSQLQTSLKNSEWIKNKVVQPMTTTFFGAFGDSIQNAFGDSKIHQFFSSTIESVGRLLPTIALSYVTGGVGMAPTMAKTMSSAYFFSSVYGGAYAEAISNGASMDDAQTYAFGNASVETLTEAIGGFAFEPIKAYSSVNKALLGMASEGFEEFLAETGSGGLSYYNNSQNNVSSANETWGETASRIAWASASGALMGAAFAGGSVAQTKTVGGNIRSVYELLDSNDANAMAKYLPKRLNAIVEILNSGKYTSEEIQKTLEETPILNEILSLDKSGVFSLNEQGKKLASGVIFARQNGQDVKTSTHAISKNIYVSDIKTSFKIKGKKIDTSVVSIDTFNKEAVREQKQNLKWAKKNGVSVAFFKTNSDFRGYFDPNLNTYFVNMANTNAFNSVVSHESYHKLKFMAKNGLMTSKQKEAFLKFEQIFKDNGEILGEFEKIGKEFNIEAFDEKTYRKLYANAKNIDALVHEERVAWFIENFFSNDKVLAKAIGKQSVLERLGSVFTNKSTFASLMRKMGVDKDDKYVLRALAKIQKSYINALKMVVQKTTPSHDIIMSIMMKNGSLSPSEQMFSVTKMNPYKEPVFDFDSLAKKEYIMPLLERVFEKETNNIVTWFSETNHPKLFNKGYVFSLYGKLLYHKNYFSPGEDAIAISNQIMFDDEANTFSYEIKPYGNEVHSGTRLTSSFFRTINPDLMVNEDEIIKQPKIFIGSLNNESWQYLKKNNMLPMQSIALTTPTRFQDVVGMFANDVYDDAKASSYDDKQTGIKIQIVYKNSLLNKDFAVFSTDDFFTPNRRLPITPEEVINIGNGDYAFVGPETFEEDTKTPKKQWKSVAFKNDEKERAFWYTLQYTKHNNVTDFEEMKEIRGYENAPNQFFYLLEFWKQHTKSSQYLKDMVEKIKNNPDYSSKKVYAIRDKAIASVKHLYEKEGNNFELIAKDARQRELGKDFGEDNNIHFDNINRFLSLVQHISDYAELKVDIDVQDINKLIISYDSTKSFDSAYLSVVDEWAKKNGINAVFEDVPDGTLGEDSAMSRFNKKIIDTPDEYRGVMFSIKQNKEKTTRAEKNFSSTKKVVREQLKELLATEKHIFEYSKNSQDKSFNDIKTMLHQINTKLIFIASGANPQGNYLDGIEDVSKSRLNAHDLSTMSKEEKASFYEYLVSFAEGNIKEYEKQKEAADTARYAANIPDPNKLITPAERTLYKKSAMSSIKSWAWTIKNIKSVFEAYNESENARALYVNIESYIHGMLLKLTKVLKYPTITVDANMGDVVDGFLTKEQIDMFVKSSFEVLSKKKAKATDKKINDAYAVVIEALESESKKTNRLIRELNKEERTPEEIIAIAEVKAQATGEKIKLRKLLTEEDLVGKVEKQEIVKDIPLVETKQQVAETKQQVVETKQQEKLDTSTKKVDIVKRYELSSDGDNRFSSRIAKFKDGRSVEEVFQLDIKGYGQIGKEWKNKRNQPSLIPYTEEELYNAYKMLWRKWAIENKSVFNEIVDKVKEGYVLSDKYAQTPNSSRMNRLQVLTELAQEEINGGIRVEHSEEVVEETTEKHEKEIKTKQSSVDIGYAVIKTPATINPVTARTPKGRYNIAKTRLLEILKRAMFGYQQIEQLVTNTTRFSRVSPQTKNAFQLNNFPVLFAELNTSIKNIANSVIDVMARGGHDISFVSYVSLNENENAFISKNDFSKLKNMLVEAQKAIEAYNIDSTDKNRGEIEKIIEKIQSAISLLASRYAQEAEYLIKIMDVERLEVERLNKEAATKKKGEIKYISKENRELIEQGASSLMANGALSVRTLSDFAEISRSKSPRINAIFEKAIATMRNSLKELNKALGKKRILQPGVSMFYDGDIAAYKIVTDAYEADKTDNDANNKRRIDHLEQLVNAKTLKFSNDVLNTIAQLKQPIEPTIDTSVKTTPVVAENEKINWGDIKPTISIEVARAQLNANQIERKQALQEQKTINKTPTKSALENNVVNNIVTENTPLVSSKQTPAKNKKANAKKTSQQPSTPPASTPSASTPPASTPPASTPQRSIFERAQERIAKLNVFSYESNETAFSAFSREFLKKIKSGKKNDVVKVIEKLYTKWERHIKKEHSGKRVINHIGSNVSKTLVKEMYGIFNSAALQGRATQLTQAEIDQLIDATLDAVFGAMIYMDTNVRVGINVTNENPNGYLYTKGGHWYLRDLMNVTSWDKKTVDKYIKDKRAKEFVELFDAISNINDKKGLYRLTRAIDKYVYETDVAPIIDMSIDGTPHTLSNVQKQWKRNAESISIMKKIIGYSPKINGTMDVFTVAEISDMFSGKGWATTVLGKMMEATDRQIQINRIYDTIFSHRGWADKNRTNIIDAEKITKGRGVTIKNLGGAVLSRAQVLNLRNMVFREKVRNLAINSNIIEGEMTKHFDDGFEVDVLGIHELIIKRKDNKKTYAVVNGDALLLELDGIVRSDIFLMEYNAKISEMHTTYHPYISERFKELNGQPLRNDGQTIRQRLELLSEKEQKNFFKHLPPNTNMEDVANMYAPFVLSDSAYFTQDATDIKQVIDLGVFDGMTQELSTSTGRVSVDSVSNVITRYVQEVGNYYGLHRAIDNFHDILNTRLENMEQDTNLKQFLDARVVKYLSDLFIDMAGYHSAPRSPESRAIMGWIRRNFYKAALGANIKVIMTQFATMFNLSSIYGDSFLPFVTNFAKNLVSQSKNGNKESLDELEKTNNYFWQRKKVANFELGEAKKGKLTGDNWFNRITEILMRGIGFTDTKINQAFYLTLLETVNPDTGALYTEAEADEVLKKAILRSQSSALAIGKSALLRTDSDLLKMFLKFTGEPLKLLTQMQSSFAQIKIIKNIKLAEKDIEQYFVAATSKAALELEKAKKEKEIAKAQENAADFASLHKTEQKEIREEIEKAEKKYNIAFEGYEEAKLIQEETEKAVKNIIDGEAKARKLMKGRMGAYASTISYLTILGFVFKMIRSKGGEEDKPEDEEQWLYLLKTFGTTTLDEIVGMFPGIRDFYNATKGWGFDQVPELASWNDLGAIFGKMTRSLFSGSDADWARLGTSAMVAFAKIFGLPTSNLERIFKTTLMYMSKESYYNYKAAMGQRTNDNIELDRAIASGNDQMISNIVDKKIRDREIKVSSVVKTELKRLTTKGFEVSMVGLNDSYTIDDVKYVLTNKQKTEFAEIYNKADFVIQKIIKSSSYRRLDDKEKAKVLRAIYSYYLKLAKQEVLGADLLPEDKLFTTLSKAYTYFKDYAEQIKE